MFLDSANQNKHTVRTLGSVIVCPDVVSDVHQKCRAAANLLKASLSQHVNIGGIETTHLFAALRVAP